MSLFINEAWAQTAPAAGAESPINSMIFMFVLLGLMYFFVLRPQFKRQKEHKNLLAALQKGDEVVASGLVGRVTKLGDQYVTVQLADNVEVIVQRESIQLVLPKGTIKNIE